MRIHGVRRATRSAGHDDYVSPEAFSLRPAVSRMKAILASLAAAVALWSCATPETLTTSQRLMDEGRFEEGLSVLEKAMADRPRNDEYRAAYFRQREIALNRLFAQAEDARSSAQAADESYRRVLKIDPNNQRARAGLESMEAEKRHRAALAEAEALLKGGAVEAAAARLRPVLAENPNNREARALQRQLDEKQVARRLAKPVLKQTFNEPVSLEFRDVTIRNIFEAITNLTGISFVLDRDIRPDARATLFVKDTPVANIVKTLLMTNQLEMMVITDSLAVIYPNTPAKNREYQELVVKTFYLSNSEAKQALNLIKTILKTRDVYIDEKLNLLVMRDTADAVRIAERLIANQDLAEPEVVLEVEVMEIKRSRFTELGIQWPSQFSVLNFANTSTVTTSAGSVVATTPSVVTNPLTLDTLRHVNTSRVGISPVVANLRKEEGDANLLANPRIRVKNRDKARILIGDRVPVITTTATANVGITESVSYLDVGLKLEVEPTVALEDEVAIKVGLEVSSVVREIKSSTGTLTYQIGTRGASTGLRLKDGETQALAGLISDEDRKSANKIPGLGDIPVLGRLFSSHRSDATKTEIILLITPHVVRNIARLDASYAEFPSGTDASTSASGAPLPAGEAAGAWSQSVPAGTPVVSPAAPFIPPAPPSAPTSPTFRRGRP